MRLDFRILLIKFVTCLLIFTIAFDLFFDSGASEIWTFSVLVTLISYYIGDKIILPRVGNRSAAIIDFFTVYGIVWVFGNILLHSYEQIAWGSIIAATLIGLSEVAVHLYILGRATPSTSAENKTIRPSQRLAFGTEFAEENNPRKK